jgi:uncharacterized OB-fold protein
VAARLLAENGGGACTLSGEGGDDSRITDVAGDRMIERIGGSRCPRCATIVTPRVRFCPYHPVEMAPVSLAGHGEILTFTTLYSPPAGFRSPLHIAIVELEGGARLVCHGEATRGIRIGSRVSVEAIDRVYYFAHLGVVDRARLFWRRAGRRGERLEAIGRSWAKRIWKGRAREESE